MKLKKAAFIAFLIVGFITVLEFVFVRGMFTWLIVVIATAVVGIVNIVISLKDKEWLQALLFLLASIALCMGYFAIV